MRGNLVLHQHHGWASGGWMSDTLVDGNVDSGSQQQWISRDSEWKSWTGSNWNMVFVGVNNPLALGPFLVALRFPSPETGQTCSVSTSLGDREHGEYAADATVW